MNMIESDWKIFRKLQAIALERYCKQVLEEVRQTIDISSSTNHERYLALWQLIKNRDELIASAFDDPRRSQALIHLAIIVREKLLNDSEVAQLSKDTRDRVNFILR